MSHKLSEEQQVKLRKSIEAFVTKLHLPAEGLGYELKAHPKGIDLTLHFNPPKSDAEMQHIGSAMHGALASKITEFSRAAPNIQERRSPISLKVSNGILTFHFYNRSELFACIDALTSQPQLKLLGYQLHDFQREYHR